MTQAYVASMNCAANVRNEAHAPTLPTISRRLGRAKGGKGLTLGAVLAASAIALPTPSKKPNGLRVG